MSKRVTRGSLKKQLEADPGMVANNAALEADVAKFKKAVAESRVKKPSVNFTVVDVMGDGNCFFRAIYKCAKYSGNLEKIVSCFLDKPVSHYEANELDFIIDMREKIAKSIEEGNDNNNVQEMYKYLNDFATNKDLKKEGLSEISVNPINGEVSFLNTENIPLDKIQSGIKGLGYQIEIGRAHV